MSENGKRSGLRLAAQLLGFLVGLGLLGFAVRLAFSEQNRASIERLTEAPPGTLALLIGLSVAPLIVNGLVYWLLIRPVQRLRAADLLATNALCTFLAYLPFKIGMLTRVAIHRKRDRVPLPRIGAWFGAFMVVFGPPLVAMVVVTKWRGDADWVWWLAAPALTLLLAWPTAWLSGLLKGAKGLDRVRRFGAWARLPWRERLLHSPAFEHLHDGFTMTGHFGSVAWSGLLRIADLTAQSWRFVVAAGVIGVELSFGEGLLLTVAYFVIALATPIGMIGTREAGAVAVAAALGLGGGEALSDDMVQKFALVALMVTGAELIATAGGAGIGLAWLRPDKLLRGATGGATGGATNGAGIGVEPGPADSIGDADRAAGDQPDGR